MSHVKRPYASDSGVIEPAWARPSSATFAACVREDRGVDVRDVLEDVARLGPFFAIGADPAEAADPAWHPLSHLYSDPRPLRDRIAHVRRVLDSDARVAASVTFQGLAARILAAPFAAAVLHGVVPRLTAAELHFQVSAAAPWPLWCPAPSAAPVPDAAAAAAALAELLVEEHFGPLVAAVRAQVPVSEQVLWGNAASTVASGKRLVVAERPAAAVRAAEVAAGLLAAGPLADRGELLAPQGPDRVWSFRRRSCCLYYRARDGGLCGDCVLQVSPAGRARG